MRLQYLILFLGPEEVLRCICYSLMGMCSCGCGGEVSDENKKSTSGRLFKSVVILEGGVLVLFYTGFFF